MILQFDAVQDVHLLPDATAAEVSTGDTCRELEHILDAVGGQLAQLAADHGFVRRADFRFDEALAIGAHFEGRDFQCRRLQRDAHFGAAAGTNLDAREHEGVIPHVLNAHVTLAGRYGADHETAVAA